VDLKDNIFPSTVININVYLSSVVYIISVTILNYGEWFTSIFQRNLKLNRLNLPVFLLPAEKPGAISLKEECMKRLAVYPNCRPVYRMQEKVFLFSIFCIAVIAHLFSPPLYAASEISNAMPATIPAEIIADWKAQDSVETVGYAAAIDAIKMVLSKRYKDSIPEGETEDVYLTACHWRRVSRMQQYSNELKRILFSRHYNLGGPTPGYLEDLESDGVVSNVGAFGTQASVSKGTQYAPGGALCVLEMENYYSRHTELLSDAAGVIKDPCVWFDGSKVAFAWSKDNNGYHIYEMNIDDPASVKQLTSNPEGLTVSDYEPCYLPDSNIIFNSSRCYGFNSIAVNLKSNLFIMSKDGLYLRRITYDQFSNFSPSIREDGYVLYTRWEANDRNPTNNFPLMTMNPDGSHQNEYFGNQCTWPSVLVQARQIPPGSGMMMAIISQFNGGAYAGELAIINPDISRNGLDAITLLAPEREAVVTDPIKNQFQNPYPFDDQNFLVSWRPSAEPAEGKYGIYFMNVSGERELLAWDSLQSVSQPISLLPKEEFPIIPTYKTDYRKQTGEVTLYNASYGTGMNETVDSTTIAKIRVIALEYRTDPVIGNTGDGLYDMTPVARWTGSREAKRIVGESKVERDCSAAFIVPARTPLYLQVIAANGVVINSQRSWFTVQPGERFSCFGCHENKNESTSQGKLPIAINPTPLEPFFDIDNDYLSFVKDIQPIFDEHCVSCHDESHEDLDLQGDLFWTGDLTDDAANKDANRNWSRSYYNVTDPEKGYINILSSQSQSEGLDPYSFGSLASPLIQKLAGGHEDIALSQVQFAKLCAWIDLGAPHSGAYTDDMKDDAKALYQQRLARRTQHEALEEQNIAAFIAAGGYPIRVDDRFAEGRKHARLGSSCLITTRFIRNSRLLSITIPSKGIISLVDLKGRQVWKVTVDQKAFLKNSTVTRPIAYPPGLYIVNFKGVNGIARELVSIL
jgi:hypothetical protein